MTELYVFGSISDAKRAGFHGPRLLHQDLPDARAWLTTRAVSDIRGIGSLSRVYITDSVYRCNHGDRQREREFYELCQHLRLYLRDAPMLWMEL